MKTTLAILCCLMFVWQQVAPAAPDNRVSTECCASNACACAEASCCSAPSTPSSSQPISTAPVRTSDSSQVAIHPVIDRAAMPDADPIARILSRADFSFNGAVPLFKRNCAWLI